MPLYRAYGLVLACTLDLPLAPAEAGAVADVSIATALGEGRRSPRPVPERELLRDGADWSLRFRDPAGHWLDYDFAAAAGTLTVAGSIDWEDAVPPLLGVVCAVLLSSAGEPLLHGAAVAHGGNALGILGDSGQGKSTLAAALVGAGGRLLSEDLLAFTPRGEELEVEPGYPRISLLPDSFEALGFGGGAPQARQGTAKSWIDSAAPEGPAPIRRLYILAPPDPAAAAGAARRLSRSAAAPALVHHLYGADWIRPVSRADLGFCASLAARVPIFELTRAATLGEVPACAAMLLADA
ncbi:MAG TPA: hypothetical protein VF605_03645 [Allosphingosinicella sp.]|jgi:hypothetical protein